MDDSRSLQGSNLAARQPQGATSVIQAITGEGLAQGPYLAARGRVEPTTFRRHRQSPLNQPRKISYFNINHSREVYFSENIMRSNMLIFHISIFIFNHPYAIMLA